MSDFERHAPVSPWAGAISPTEFRLSRYTKGRHSAAQVVTPTVTRRAIGTLDARLFLTLSGVAILVQPS